MQVVHHSDLENSLGLNPRSPYTLIPSVLTKKAAAADSPPCPQEPFEAPDGASCVPIVKNERKNCQVSSFNGLCRLSGPKS